MPARTAPVSPESAISPITDIPAPQYDDAPFLAIWEVTRACDLACVHCRACAIPGRDPEELTLAEARNLFAEIREMGTRLLVLTGGDPVKRADIFELIRSAREAGLDPALSPSATPLLTPQVLREAAAAGAGSLSLSLDGGAAATHDAFRGVPGAFVRTIESARAARMAGIEVRINTTVTSRNLLELPRIAEITKELSARVWSVFFLVATGRASQAMQISAERCEIVLNWLYDLSGSVPFRIKTTEAPHYRRVVLQRMAEALDVPVSHVIATTKSGRGRFLPGMNDGRGFVFISHTGDVYPSGFFPLSAGNVRRCGLAETYRESPLFRDLRNAARLHGKCGRCEFRSLCGGSRARAFAASGDPLGEDPLCAYQPNGAAA